MVLFKALVSELTQRVNRVLVVGTRDSLLAQLAADSFLQQTLARASAASGAAPVSFAPGSANAVLLAHAVEHLSPTNDNGASAQLLLVRDGGASDALPVAVFALPQQVSRANTPARPHAIHAFVKAHRALQSKPNSEDSSSDDVALVVLALPGHEDTWYAAGAAVARAAPQYVHKGNKLSGLALESADDAVQVDADHLAVVYEHALNAKDLALVQHTADAIQLAARLTDAPPNELHADTFIAEAKRVAQRTNAQITVIQGEELRERGLGGIYGVGKAAVHQPALIVLSYYPPGTTAETPGVALVGKGIVYDTGGPLDQDGRLHGRHEARHGRRRGSAGRVPGRGARAQHDGPAAAARAAVRG
ncbi:hypothetical protein PINS_up012433 [Pythium insidiosum]|nr:hypothetical protein PINS_up012433 [Pythium insidiosum]